MGTYLNPGNERFLQRVQSEIYLHCDAKPFNSREFGNVLLSQEITATVVGNCGISMTSASFASMIGTGAAKITVRGFADTPYTREEMEAARDFGFEDPADCAAYLMHDEDGRTAIINMSMYQEDIDTVAKLPYSVVISDSIYADTNTPHPRMYGAFPRQ